MSTSTDAILAYGYDLGSGDERWKIREASGEYGELELDWYDNDGNGGDDFIDAAKKRLLAASGFTETDGQVDGFYRRRREAEEALGVEFASYCSLEYPMFVLATKKITVYRGHSKLIDPAALAADPVEGGWDARLAAAIETLGITPLQEKPGWVLVSDWG